MSGSHFASVRCAAVTVNCWEVKCADPRPELLFNWISVVWTCPAWEPRRLPFSSTQPSGKHHSQQCSVGENTTIRERQKPCCSRPTAGTHKAADKTDGRAPERTKVKMGEDCQQAARSQVVCSHCFCYCVVTLKTTERFKWKCIQVNQLEVGNLFCKGDLAAGSRQKLGTIEKCVWDKQRSSPV